MGVRDSIPHWGEGKRGMKEARWGERRLNSGHAGQQAWKEAVRGGGNQKQGPAMRVLITLTAP